MTSAAVSKGFMENYGGWYVVKSGIGRPATEGRKKEEGGEPLGECGRQTDTYYSAGGPEMLIV